MVGMSSVARKTAKGVSIAQAAFNALKRNPVGEVHSVFDRTFNVLVGGELVGVARSGISLSPIDLITDIHNSETMPSLGVRKGMRVQMAGDRMIVDKALEISLDGVKVWQSPTRVERPNSRELIKRNLELAKRSAKRRAGREGLGQLLVHVDTIARGEIPAYHDLNDVAKASLPHLVNLVKFVKLADVDGVKNAAKKLVGLGPGLSPSADDMLSGLTSALWWLSKSLGKDVELVGRINEAIVFHAGSTNLLSRQLLQHAARGEVNERLGELLRVLLAGQASEIDQLVERVMKIGETSGIDMMVGLLLGIQVGLEELAVS